MLLSMIEHYWVGSIFAESKYLLWINLVPVHFQSVEEKGENDEQVWQSIMKLP